MRNNKDKILDIKVQVTLGTIEDYRGVEIHLIVGMEEVVLVTEG